MSTEMQNLFLASVTHDLRTPLNSILAFNQVLFHLYKSDLKAQNILKLQKNSALFMTNLIEDILDLSKINFDKFDPQTSWFNISEVVEDVFNILEY